jgi:O-antigen/teichoic acid export membrane protein
MTRIASLRGALSVMALSTAATQAVNVAMIPALARLFGPEDLGYLSLVLSAAIIAVPACTFNLAFSLPQQRDDREAADVLALLAGLAVAGPAVLAAAAWAVFAAVGPQAAIPADAVLWGLALVPFLVLVDALRMLGARAGRYGAVGGQGVLLAVARAAVQAAGGLAGAGAAALVAAEAVGRAVSAAPLRAVAAAAIAGAGGGAPRPAAALRRNWRFPAVAAPSALLDNLGGYLPPVVLGAAIGTEAAGHYFLAQRVVALPIVLLVQSTAEVIQVRAADLVRAGGGGLLRFVGRAAAAFAAAGLAIVGAAALFAAHLWSPVFGGGWEPARDAVFAMLAPAVLQATAGPLGRVLVAADRQAWKLWFDAAFLCAALSPAAAAAAGWEVGFAGSVRLIALGQAAAYVVYVAAILAAAARPRRAEAAPGTADQSIP